MTGQAYSSPFFYKKAFLFWIFLPLLVFSCYQPFQNSKPVLKIGADKWSLQEVQSYMEMRLNHINSQESPEQLKELFLKEILFQSLLKDWSKKNKIQLKRKFWNRKDLIFFLTDPSKLKALKRHQNFILLKSALLQDLKNKIPEPDLKTQKAFYQNNKALFKESAKCQLKQILVKNEKLASSLYKRLKKGESFDALAKNFSLKKDLGWIEQGQLEVFDKACFKSSHYPTPPLKSPYGYHIFLKTASKPSKQKKFKNVREAIISYLKEKKTSSVFQNWLKEESLKKSFWMDKKSLDQIKIQYKRETE